MPLFHVLAAFAGLAGLGVAAGYSLLTLIAVLAWRSRGAQVVPDVLPPVTLLKPLCGAEPGLYEHLRGFCVQNYRDYEIVFGVRDEADPACAVARRLMAEYPALPTQLVIDPRLHGTNHKISNLINMLARAHHDYFVMADSDAFVEPDYLATVTAPLLDPRVGLVTCTYRGVPTDGIWSRLGAMYINEWYAPSILVAWLFGYRGYVSGQTMCIRRQTLESLGGLEAIADHLADDHRLGVLVQSQGLEIVLSPYVVKGEHDERSLASLIRHEQRWMRTIHVLRPMSFRMIFLSFSFPLALGGLGLLWTLPAFERLSSAAWALFGVAVGVRLMLHFLHRSREDRHPFVDLWLLPIRDWLLCWVWLRSFFSSRVTWRGSEFIVDADGLLRRLT
jgi:ceramide glucosyltransferase